MSSSPVTHAAQVSPADKYAAFGGAWTGWIAFAGIIMALIGILDAIEGLIAIIRGQYFVVTANQLIIFDSTTWGWIMLVWGFIVAAAGFGLLARAGWARWFTIIVVALNFIVELSFVGSAEYPLWALTVLALSVFVLYALVVRWDEQPV